MFMHFFFLKEETHFTSCRIFIFLKTKVNKNVFPLKEKTKKFKLLIYVCFVFASLLKNMILENDFFFDELQKYISVSSHNNFFKNKTKNVSVWYIFVPSSG